MVITITPCYFFLNDIIIILGCRFSRPKSSLPETTWITSKDMTGYAG